MGSEIIKAAGLPEHLADLWVVEAFIDGLIKGDREWVF